MQMHHTEQRAFFIEGSQKFDLKLVGEKKTP